MIRNSTQNWTIGNTVKVDFLSLKIVGMRGLAYKLESAKGQAYEFTPYTGLINA